MTLIQNLSSVNGNMPTKPSNAISAASVARSGQVANTVVENDVKLAGGCAHAVLQTLRGPGAGIGTGEENYIAKSRCWQRPNYTDLIGDNINEYEYIQHDLIDACTTYSSVAN